MNMHKYYRGKMTRKSRDIINMKNKKDSTPTTNAQREREWEETEEEQRRSIRSKTKKANKSSMIRGHQMIFISFSYREWTLIQFVKISCFEKEGR